MRQLLVAALATVALLPGSAGANPPNECPDGFTPTFFVSGLEPYATVDRNNDQLVCERFTPQERQILIDNNAGGPN